jgi:hypothetical protein
MSWKMPREEELDGDRAPCKVKIVLEDPKVRLLEYPEPPEAKVTCEEIFPHPSINVKQKSEYVPVSILVVGIVAVNVPVVTGALVGDTVPERFLVLLPSLLLQYDKVTTPEPLSVIGAERTPVVESRLISVDAIWGAVVSVPTVIVPSKV